MIQNPLSNAGGAAYEMKEGGGGDWLFKAIQNNGGFKIRDNAALQDRLTITNTGDIGIGNSSPVYKLDVSGTGRFTSQVTIPQTPIANTDAASKWYVDNAVSAASSGPGGWSCTVRTASNTGSPATVSCQGAEKVISGGCKDSVPNDGYYAEDHPTGQGWTCKGSGLGINTAYANCCQ